MTHHRTLQQSRFNMTDHICYRHDMLCSILNVYTNSAADQGIEFIPQRLLEAAGRAANYFYDCREDELAVCLQVVCSVRIMENALATPLLVRFLGLVDSWMEYLIRDPSRKFTDRDYNDVVSMIVLVLILLKLKIRLR
jgi:hypothetical protein